MGDREMERERERKREMREWKRNVGVGGQIRNHPYLLESTDQNQ